MVRILQRMLRAINLSSRSRPFRNLETLSIRSLSIGCSGMRLLRIRQEHGMIGARKVDCSSMANLAELRCERRCDGVPWMGADGVMSYERWMRRTDARDRKSVV